MPYIHSNQIRHLRSSIFDNKIRLKIENSKIVLVPVRLKIEYSKIVHVHCKKKSVDFTVKYLASGCQFFYRYFYGRLPVEHF